MGLKQNRTWLVALFLITLTLAACERPYPQPEPEAVIQPDPDLAMTVPAVQPEEAQPTPIEETLQVATPLPVQPTGEPEPAEPPVQDTIHTVQPGDTLFKIGSQYGVTIDVIIAANDIPDINQLTVGQQLIISPSGSVAPTATVDINVSGSPIPPEGAPTEIPPGNDGTHVVQAGENLYRIGLKYGCSTNQMAAANGISNVSLISVGQVLQIPDCN